ncbi:unnamed protein product [Rangifer tarandus platyrhynchus]|uniref:Uncharacterized protein n=1 Tax=Rangifer tarandus platyrhynchus TaxID=3082113 RepID=A0ABN8XZR2_RANTA|nr:unnamed protein product [Rangifer tarandus platyrhynchus]
MGVHWAPLLREGSPLQPPQPWCPQKESTDLIVQGAPPGLLCPLLGHVSARKSLADETLTVSMYDGAAPLDDLMRKSFRLRGRPPAAGPFPRPGPWGAESPPRSAGRPALPAPSPATVTAACCPEPIARPLHRPSLLIAPPEAGALILCLLLGRRLGSERESHGAPGPAGLYFRTLRGCDLITWPPTRLSRALGPGFGRRKKRGRLQPSTQARSSRNVCPRRLSEKNELPVDSPLSLSRPGHGEVSKRPSSLKNSPDQYNAAVTTNGEQPQGRCPQTRRRPGERAQSRHAEPAHASPPPGPEEKPRQQPPVRCETSGCCQLGVGAGGVLEGSTGGF